MSGKREEILGEAFVDLADTLVADYDVIDLLSRLVEVCVELLDVDAAGLLLSDQRGDLVPLAASSENARLLELFQLQADEGPCLDSYRAGTPISCADVAGELHRWPRFAQRAQHLGFASVHALPLRLREQTIGALNLLGATSGPMPPEDLRLGQALADVATIGILQERAINHAGILARQLEGALNSRIIIEQSKGVLAERAQISTDEAFTRLRGYARGHHVRLVDVARAMVLGNEEFPELVRAVDRTERG